MQDYHHDLFVRPCYDHLFFVLCSPHDLVYELGELPVLLVAGHVSWLAGHVHLARRLQHHVASTTSGLLCLISGMTFRCVFLTFLSVFFSWLAIACLAASDLDFLYLTSGLWITLPVHASLLYNFWLFFRHLLLGFLCIPIQYTELEFLKSLWGLGTEEE